MRETLRDRIDKLVTWYEKNKPEAGKRIDVDASPMQLAKALNWRPQKPDDKPPHEFDFRGRTVVSISRSEG